MSGPKLTVHDAPTPSAELTRAAQNTAVVEAGARRIVLKSPGIVAQYRICRALGAEASANPTFMAMVAPLLYVQQIDDEPVFFPGTEEDVYGLVEQLGDDGLQAVMKGVQEHFAPDPEADKTAAKK